MEVDLDLILKLHLKLSTKFNPLPKFPSVRRDISIIVDDSILVGDLVKEVRNASKLIENVWAFDIFRGESLDEGKKSVAISMLLRAADKTLTDEEANIVRNEALRRVNKSLGAVLRPN